ncbi:MAG: hypothetical protein IE885_01720 [Campylobacterales bacterium]|nr:hypothetical protein [Campylobacterales bacterium]
MSEQDHKEKILDQWKITLLEKKKQLQECQASRGFESCLNCELVLNCELRDMYVVAVYDSMNKGQGGGFEF